MIPKIKDEFSGTLTLTENSTKELFRVLKEQDETFISDVLDGKYGFTLKSADGRSVELIPADKRQGKWKLIRSEIEMMSDDLIKREDAIRALRLEYPMMPMSKELREEWAIKTEGFRKAEKVIMMLPSADRPSATEIMNAYHEGVRKGIAEAYEAYGADRPQRWIPCSERLPSEQGQYLVTLPLCDGEPCVYVLSFNKGKFYETDDEWGDVEYDDVTAWMPLPKPFEGAEDGKECHKPESEYYRSYCEERREETYCEGCKFWY